MDESRTIIEASDSFVLTKPSATLPCRNLLTPALDSVYTHKILSNLSCGDVMITQGESELLSDKQTHSHNFQFVYNIVDGVVALNIKSQPTHDCYSPLTRRPYETWDRRE